MKRIGLGLLAMTLASIALAFVPPVFPVGFDAHQFFLSQPLPTLEQSLKFALAAFLGAYVARVPFVLATIAYYVGMTIYVSHVLALIAEPVEPISILEVAAMNSVGTAAGLIAVVIGADLGTRAGSRKWYGRARTA